MKNEKKVRAGLKASTTVIIMGVLLLGNMSMNVLAGNEGVSFKGDLRLRYQMDSKDGSDDRSRARLRYRLGSKATVNENTTVYAGLASGDDDPRSTNQSFDNSFSTKGINLDYAYMKMDLGYMDLMAGKMKNPLWRVSDLMWDSDIRPEGLAIHYKASDAYFVNAAYFVLAEIESGTDSHLDPSMWVLQPGGSWQVSEKMTLSAAASLYSFTNIKGRTLEHSEATNTLVSGGLKEDFSVVGLSGKLSWAQQFGFEIVEAYGEYLQNTKASDKNQGYLAGVKFGDKKLKTIGDWQSKIQYRHLGADATLDIFPDSDVFGGATGIKGLELIAKFGLSKDLAFTIDYYASERLSDGTKETVVQADLGITF